MSNHLCLTSETTNPDEFTGVNLRECAVCWEKRTHDEDFVFETDPGGLRSIDEEAYLDDES